MGSPEYAKPGTRVRYHELTPEYIQQCKNDGIPATTIQHNRMMAHTQSRRRKFVNYDCNNIARKKSVRDRLRNKLKFKGEIQLKKVSKSK